MMRPESDLKQALVVCAENLALLQAKITEVLALDTAEPSAKTAEILALQEQLVGYCQQKILDKLPASEFRLGVEVNKQINLLSIDGQQLKIARQAKTQQLRLQQMQTRLQLIGAYVEQISGNLDNEGK